MSMKIDWRGPQVKAKIERSVEKALVDVGAECVAEAKGRVPVATAILQRSIRFDPPEKTSQGRTRLRWGSFSVHYALAVETGNRSLAGPVPHNRPRVKQVETRTRKGQTNFLRGAAQNNYPKLASAIRRRFQWLISQ